MIQKFTMKIMAYQILIQLGLKLIQIIQVKNLPEKNMKECYRVSHIEMVFLTYKKMHVRFSLKVRET